MATNQGFKSLVPDSRRVDSKFLFHWLKSKTSFLQGLGNGATFKEISKGVVERIEIPLPPLDEQRRIAAILDQADALCRQRKRALDLLDSLTQSIFLETIGRSVSRPARGLLELFDVTTGKLDSNAAKVGGEFPFFTCARELSWIDSYAFDCEALLLAGNNASADYSVKHYVGKFNAYQRTYVLRLKDSQNYCRFFKAALENRLSELKWRSKGTNTKYLTLKVLDELQVPTPDLKAQAWFNFLAEKIDAERSRMAAYMEQTRDLFVSLRHRAFSGQL
jgi:type I restriction enzyme S subunit